ncbi:MAG: RES family NAD+ phosphorylase [Gemmatimonadaceae bacterium]
MPWRCFPWNPEAAEGEPFSPTYLAPGQTVGRFDLHDRPPVRYLAESPEHAIGETLAPFRGTGFRPSYLRLRHHPLALVEVTLAPEVARRVADCTDPATLAALALRPDELAHHDRTVTQAIARRLHDDPAPGGSRYAGLRWWSAITGAWHTIVLFTDRAPADSVRFGAPRPLTPADPAVRHVLAALGIRVR